MDKKIYLRLWIDELKELSKEIIRNEADEKVMIALDYFINGLYGA